MKDIFKKLLCRHNYAIIDTVETLYGTNKHGDLHIFTDLLECTKCGKRRVVSPYSLLVPELYMKRFKLWEKYQMDIGQFSRDGE